MSEIRQDKLTDRWVICAPERAHRPHEHKRESRQTGHPPQKGAGCPFCPGNEHMLESIVAETSPEWSDSWQTRVVENKYPVVGPAPAVEGGIHGIYFAAPGYGVHEVIVEHPHHNRQLGSMSRRDMEVICRTYRDSYRRVMQADEKIASVTIFRNHGPAAGTSLVHPHSQLVATGIVPNRVAVRETVSERYYRLNERCVLCDVLKYEREHGQRIVYESDKCLAFVPFAARVPFEIIIAPKTHNADFADAEDSLLADLAASLLTVLKGLRGAAEDPDYNYIFQTFSRQRKKSAHLHWYLQITPRMTIPAGFEIGSGIGVNASLPETDAESLRCELEKMRAEQPA